MPFVISPGCTWKYGVDPSSMGAHYGIPTRNGRNQALRIPREFELDGDEAIVRREGDRLIVEPVRKGALLSVLASLEPLEERADQAYGELRAILESRGEVIGPNDMLIAAHALSLDKVVVSANQREFSRIPGLRVENWID